ncbi:MAG: PorT family protein [Bacteroidetes bacterium]|nr:PorT family protein [Bacteroidota bacterium]
MKNTFIILAFVSASIVSHAQTNNDIIPPQPIEQSKFSIGVKGAFGHSFLMPYSEPAFMPSWDAGISTIFSPYEHLGFGIDATYSGEGVKFVTPEYTSVTHLNYVRVPVKVIYFFRHYDKDFRPKVAIGPTIGFLTNKGENAGYNKFDFGANASLGFNYRLLRAVWLNADASYYQGFTDVYKSNNEKDLNGNVRLNLGLSFGF